jgi:CheY-like chemotaxis protein/predicted Ser/Thr protein kinase
MATDGALLQRARGTSDAALAQKRTPSTPAAIVDDRYEIERELGRGGMGVVYLARDLRLRRGVALKTLAAQYQKNPSLVGRFRLEAEALASVRHENVVQVFNFCEGDPPTFVMELVRGESLADVLWDHLRIRATLPIGRVLSIVRKIAGALDAVHAAGILHRDVKPENIVIEERTGRPVLIDFGLVFRLGDEMEIRTGYGTPQYMAPETCPGGAPSLIPTPSVDLYSLGCTAFELLTGRPVFDSPLPTVIMAQQRNDRPPPPSAFRRELAPFDDVFRRALAKDPANRFETAAAFASALDRAGRAWTKPAAILPPLPTRHDDPDALRVLVVDDDDSFRRISARAAQLAFYRRRVVVQAAEDGEAALLLAATSAPHIIILDYAMPNLNGVDTLARIRDLPGCAETRVLVVSANARAEQRARFALLGVSDFIEKPIVLRAFIEMIAALEPGGNAQASEPKRAWPAGSIAEIATGG